MSNPDLIQRGNMHFRLCGKNNSGIAQRNMNTDFVGETNIVSLNAEMNLRFTGNKNQVDFDQNVNCHFIGNKNNCELSHNTNFELIGDSNDVKAERNTNLEVKGDSNDVTGERNTNLKIDGNLNSVTILGTTNHVVKNVGYNSDECAKNVVKVLRTANLNSSVTNFGLGASVIGMIGHPGLVSIVQNLEFGSSGMIQNLEVGSSVVIQDFRLRYLIDYVKEARIVDKDYSIGIFNFTMEEINKTVHISFDENQFDPGSVTITEVTPGEFEIIALKNGTQQILTFLGSKISHRLSEGVNKLEITVDSATEQN